MCVLVKMVTLRPCIILREIITYFEGTDSHCWYHAVKRSTHAKLCIISHASNVFLKFLLSLFSMIICVDVFIAWRNVNSFWPSRDGNYPYMPLIPEFFFRIAPYVVMRPNLLYGYPRTRFCEKLADSSMSSLIAWSRQQVYYLKLTTNHSARFRQNLRAILPF